MKATTVPAYSSAGPTGSFRHGANPMQAARVSTRRQYVTSLRAARPDVPWRVNVARQTQCQRRLRGDRGRFGADQAPLAELVVARMDDRISLADLEAACCYALQLGQADLGVRDSSAGEFFIPGGERFIPGVSTS